MMPEIEQQAPRREALRPREQVSLEGERRREGREVAAALEGLRGTLREQELLRRQTRELLDKELKAADDPALRTEGNKLLGRSYGLTERMRGTLRRIMTGAMLLFTGDSSVAAARDAMGCTEKEEEVEEEQPTQEDIDDTRRALEVFLERTTAEREPTSLPDIAPSKDREMLSREREESERRRQRARGLAAELIDFAQEASMDELREAYRVLLEGEDRYIGHDLEAEIRKGVRELEAQNPDAAKRLAELSGPEEVFDSAIRRKDAEAVYDQVAERLSEAILHGERSGIVELTGRDNLGELYRQIASLDRARREAIAGLIEEWISMQQRELEQWSDRIQRGEADDTGYPAAQAQLERMRRFLAGLREDSTEVEF